jgi:hypothetical protein
MVHLDRTVVVLLHKQALSFCLSTSLNSISIVTNGMYAIMSKPNNTVYINDLFTFFKSAYYVLFVFDAYCVSPILYLDCTR